MSANHRVVLLLSLSTDLLLLSFLPQFNSSYFSCTLVNISLLHIFAFRMHMHRMHGFFCATRILETGCEKTSWTMVMDHFHILYGPNTRKWTPDHTWVQEQLSHSTKVFVQEFPGPEKKPHKCKSALLLWHNHMYQWCLIWLISQLRYFK